MSEYVLNKGNLEKSSGKADYSLPHGSSIFSTISALIPAVSGVSGNRVLLGDKSFIQAIPLVSKETPWVLPAPSEGAESFYKTVGKKLCITSDVSGEVTHAGKDKITVRHGDKDHDHCLFHNFVSGKKNFIDHTPIVKVGDKVKKEISK